MKKPRYNGLAFDCPDLWNRILFGSGDKQRLLPGYIERSFDGRDEEGRLPGQTGCATPFPCRPHSLLAHLTRPHACVSGHIFRTWKERWFVLDGPLLKYYKSSESSEGRQSGQPGQLELKGL